MLRNIAPRAENGTTGRARTLRRQMTLPEVLLWRALRKRPRGLKFRRQHPSGVYILDFFCSDARLAIEIDGETHATATERDGVRDAWFAATGIATLRIPARDVLGNLDGVLMAVMDAAVARLPLHHPSGGPPPRDELGEDF
jgi:very-short-patch-repair endonuclease